MRRISLLLPLTLALACGDKDAGDSGDIDADGDGVSVLEDCDDDDATAFPGNTETCDGVDNDCDGVIDNDVKLTFYADADGDGFGDANDAEEGCTPWGEYIEDNTDCDDSSDAIYPGAPEDDCTDPVDYNCDGSVQYADADGDGHAACVDCDDNNSTINPDAVEECDYLDNNCDGTVDEGSALDADTFYADLDEDGYGDAANTTTACHEAPSGYVDDATDCDDANGNTYPGAVEICDAADNDCDGAVGEALVPTDYASIQEGIDSGETWICVEAGTYIENLVVDVTSDLTLEGVGSADVTLNGGGTGIALEATVSGGAVLTIGGMTVIGGYADDGYAGGVRTTGDDTDTVVFSDLILTDNTCEATDCFGAALAADSHANVELWDVTVTDNELLGNPYGVISLYPVQDVTIDGLEIYDEEYDLETGSGWTSGLFLLSSGGTIQVNDLSTHDFTVTGQTVYAPAVFYGAETIDVTNAEFYGNDSTMTNFCVAPGLFLYGNEVSTIQNVSIIGNSCTADGDVYTGGLWPYTGQITGNSDASFEATNVIIAGNTATAGGELWGGVVLDFAGGGPWKHTYTNVSVYGNDVSGATGSGGWVSYNTDVSLTNVDYSGNSVDVDSTDSADGFGFYDGGTGNESFSWAYNNLADLGVVAFDPSLTDPTGTDGNISVDPGYTDVTSTDPTAWDLTLATGSALIDAGDPSLLDTDDTTSDIGAHGGPGADL